MERPSQGQGRRARAVDMERRTLLLLLLVGELARSGLTSREHQDWLLPGLVEHEGGTATTSGLGNHWTLHCLVHRGDGGLHLRPVLLLHQLLHTHALNLLQGLLCSSPLTFGPGHFTGIRLGLLG